MKRISLALLPLLLFILVTQKAQAQTPSCQPIYGGGQTCVETGDLTVDKKIRFPTTDRFVDDLTTDSPTFRPDQIISFTIEVKNVGNRSFSDITIEDVLPQALVYRGNTGHYDKAKKTLTFTIDKLEKGQTKRVTFDTYVAKAEALPNGDVTCLANQAKAFTNGTKDNPSTDTAKFCVERPKPQPRTATGQPSGESLPPTSKGGLPIAPQPKGGTTPKTGPEAIALIGLIPAGLGGWLLRRRAK